MATLYAEKTIEISASVEKVWEVLTSSTFTCQWVSYFQPIFAFLESDWQLGSHVAWQDKDKKTQVDGIVTGINAPLHLSFSVHDVSGQFDSVQSDEDGIFYDLQETNDGTRLIIRQGDFSKVGEKAEEFCKATAESWGRVLPVIKKLAEQ